MPLIIPSNSISGEFEVANSLRFDDGSSDYLSRTQTSGNKKIFTLSVWLKRTDTLETYIFSAGPNSTARTQFNFNGSSQLMLYNNDGGTVNVYLRTNKLFRDPSAWYHIVLRYDSTQSTASDRVRLYVSGVQETSFATETYPSQNADNIQFNSNTVSSSIGRRHYDNNHHFNGYMSEFVYLDGQSLDPTSFGEFDADTGIWKPKNVSGLTFGTNGFYLDFENSGSLGADVSGNANNFTVNNLTSIDQTTDTPTNNFCTLNPLQAQISGATLSEGNTKLVSTAGTPYTGTTGSTMAFSKGKWYHEVKYISAPSTTYPSVGFGEVSQVVTGSDKYLENAQGGSFNAISVSAGRSTNNVYLTGSGNITYSGSDFPFSTNDILMVAIDYDNDKIWWGKNGTWLASGDPANGTNPSQSSFISAITPNDDHITPYFGDGNYATAMTMEVNFGNPSFSISSGNSDANGYGNFEYSVPSGYYALNTKNLAEFG